MFVVNWIVVVIIKLGYTEIILASRLLEQGRCGIFQIWIAYLLNITYFFKPKGSIKKILETKVTVNQEKSSFGNICFTLKTIS